MKTCYFAKWFAVLLFGGHSVAHAIDTVKTTISVQQPQLSLTNPDTCLQPGQPIRLEGKYLGTARQYQLWIQSGKQQLELKPEAWNDSSITAHFPSNFTPQQGERIEITLRDRSGRGMIGKSQSLQFCATESEPETPAPTNTITPQHAQQHPMPPINPGTLAIPAAISPPTSQGGQASYAAHELLIFSNTLSEAETLAGTLAQYGYRIKRRRILKHLDLILSIIRLPQEVTPAEAMKILRQSNPGLMLDANHFYHLMSSEQEKISPVHKLIGWGKANMSCGTGLRIGLIDTQVDTTVKGLTEKRVVTRSFLPLGTQAADSRHGTAIASLLVSSPGNGVAGLLPGANLYAAAVFRKTETEGEDTSAELIIAALDWLMGEHVSVVNLSLAGSDNRLLRRAITALEKSGHILVAAAGNGGANAPPAFPAALPEVVAVTAVDINGQIYRNANQGEYIDLAAPGVDIWAARPGTKGAYYSGTSYAAPFVTAAIARLQHAQPAKKKKTLLAMLTKSARDLGRKGRDPVYGDGLLQVKGDCVTENKGHR